MSSGPRRARGATGSRRSGRYPCSPDSSISFVSLRLGTTRRATWTEWDRVEEIETGKKSKLVTSSLTDYLKPLPGTDARQPSRKDLVAFSNLADQFMRARPQEPPFASAPVHPVPRRTYDPVKVEADPWGTDVPSRFASLQFRDKAGWGGHEERAGRIRPRVGIVRRLHGENSSPASREVHSSSRCGSSARTEERDPSAI